MGISRRRVVIAGAAGTGLVVVAGVGVLKLTNLFTPHPTSKGPLTPGNPTATGTPIPAYETPGLQAVATAWKDNRITVTNADRMSYYDKKTVYVEMGEWLAPENGTYDPTEKVVYEQVFFVGITIVPETEQNPQGQKHAFAVIGVGEAQKAYFALWLGPLGKGVKFQLNTRPDNTIDFIGHYGPTPMDDFVQQVQSGQIQVHKTMLAYLALINSPSLDQDEINSQLAAAKALRLRIYELAYGSLPPGQEYSADDQAILKAVENTIPTAFNPNDPAQRHARPFMLGAMVHPGNQIPVPTTAMADTQAPEASSAFSGWSQRRGTPEAR